MSVTTNKGEPGFAYLSSDDLIEVRDVSSNRWGVTSVDYLRAGFVSVKDYGAAGDGETDDTAAFAAALATGNPVFVPWSDAAYLVSFASQAAAFSLSSDATIVGDWKRPTIKGAGASGRVFTLTSVSRVLIKNLIIDGNKASGISTALNVALSGATDCIIENVRFQNSSSTSLDLSGASERNKIRQCEFVDADGYGIQLNGSSVRRNVIVDNYGEDNGGFTILLKSGANNNEVRGNRCYSNGLELIGITYDCWGNRIAANHAEGTGDNGISVSGYQNTVIGNVARYCRYNGISLYGSHNVASGNLCVANGQHFLTDASDWAGIRVRPEFGGSGRYNIVTGNICIDDQAVPTQAWGVRLHANANILWAQGQSITANSGASARYYGLNVYAPTTSGTTGATPPTHTSGTASDGGVTWQFLFSATGNLNARDTIVSDNRYLGNRLVGFSDATTNANHSQFGVLTANADAAITGYVQIVDEAGTVRKLAVIA